MKLFIILNDPLSPILDKGEITARYFNPGNIFNEVHILLCNNDQPDISKVQPMVGTAKLYIHNLPTPDRFFYKTLGWRKSLMKRWLQGAKVLAKQIKPDLVRCHGSHINAIAAIAMRDVINVPVVVSLHHHPESVPQDISKMERLQWFLLQKLAVRGLKAADIVLAVYHAQISYLNKIDCKTIELAYNALNPTGLVAKTEYDLHEPVRVLSVGRLIPGKNPENLVRAIADIDNVELEIIGDGPLRPMLMQLVELLKIEEKVKFTKSVENDQLCRTLKGRDIFAVHNDYPGVPKAVFEPLLAGLPVIVNDFDENVIPELTGDICLRVENTKEGYKQGLLKLIAVHSFRKSLGQRAYQVAQEKWSPAKTEGRYVNIYRKALKANNDS